MTALSRTVHKDAITAVQPPRPGNAAECGTEWSPASGKVRQRLPPASFQRIRHDFAEADAGPGRILL